VAHFIGRALSDPAMPARLVAGLARPGRESAARAALGPTVHVTSDATELARLCDLVVDCAGHAGLRAHGAEILGRGCPLITLSLGALADPGVLDGLRDAALRGGTFLQLASGAIGALDALSAASTGRIDAVRYTGRKPPVGWRGSPAADVLDLDRITQA